MPSTLTPFADGFGTPGPVSNGSTSNGTASNGVRPHRPGTLGSSNLATRPIGAV